ncbi:hypothetical protein LINGRAHAP2_LOCUS8008 [Linum grandiflorum]
MITMLLSMRITTRQWKR